MNFADKIIIALYRAEQRNMQYSGGKARLFIAKCVFCLLIWIWLLPVLGILENNLGFIEISFSKPKSRWAYLPLLFVMYFILNYLTVKIDKVDEFVNEAENIDEVKRFRKIFLILLTIGFIFLVSVAKYNAGNTLSD